MEHLKEIEERARLGDILADFANNGSLAILEDHILKPLDRGAFETFKKVDPSNLAEVMQTQMMSKVIDRIRQEIHSKIEEGKLAKQTLLDYSTQKEDE